MTTSSLDPMLERLEGVKKTGPAQWKAKCPAHDDKTPSLGVGLKAGGLIVINCLAGCEPEAVMSAIGMSLADLAPDRGRSYRTEADRPGGPLYKPKLYATASNAIAALEHRLGPRSRTWVYANEWGAEVAYVLRWDKPDGSKYIRPVSRVAGGWTIQAQADPRLLYRLPELAAADVVWVTEGEKAADALRAIGLTATTSAGGSKAARKTDWSPLKGIEVVILPDFDEPGEAYARDVIAELELLTEPPKVRVLRLKGLPKGGDAYDYVEACREHGMTDDEIVATLERLATQQAEERRPERKAGLIVINAHEVEPQAVQWLWHARIVARKVNLVIGNAGQGKSFFTLDVASRVSAGTPWPDRRDEPIEPGHVLILSAEDGVADTIVPRLINAKGDLHRVKIIKGIRRLDGDSAPVDMLRLDADLAKIEELLIKPWDPPVRLLIIDPISAYMGKADSHNDAEVRAVLEPVSALAERHGLAILAVMHLRKTASERAIHRASGSIAFAAAARSVWLITEDRDDPERRLYLWVKCNVARNPGGLAYRIEDPGVVAWEDGTVDVTADEALSERSRDRAQTKELDDACEWLQQTLAAGPVKAADMYELGEIEGYNERTIRRAKVTVNAVAFRQATGDKVAWYWRLRT